MKYELDWPRPASTGLDNAPDCANLFEKIEKLGPCLSFGSVKEYGSLTLFLKDMVLVAERISVYPRYCMCEAKTLAMTITTPFKMEVDELHPNFLFFISHWDRILKFPFKCHTMYPSKYFKELVLRFIIDGHMHNPKYITHYEINYKLKIIFLIRYSLILAEFF